MAFIYTKQIGIITDFYNFINLGIKMTKDSATAFDFNPWKCECEIIDFFMIINSETMIITALVY